MKDYASMSDFEINKSVALALGFRLYKDGKSCRENHVAIEEGRCGAFSMDWCNNPADAWPIITENRISTIYLDENEWGCRGEGDKSACRAINSNALRCAMIVFLMMKENEND